MILSHKFTENRVCNRVLILLFPTTPPTKQTLLFDWFWSKKLLQSSSSPWIPWQGPWKKTWAKVTLDIVCLGNLKWFPKAPRSLHRYEMITYDLNLLLYNFLFSYEWWRKRIVLSNQLKIMVFGLRQSIYVSTCTLTLIFLLNKRLFLIKYNNDCKSFKIGKNQMCRITFIKSVNKYMVILSIGE